jgi:ABC-type multidrug transport system fused ATPase/permease subunit
VASVQRVFHVHDREVAVRDAHGAISLPRLPRTLTLEGISFGYYEDRPVLQGISAEIKPGQMVAFVGASGVGKSTLLNLFPRFYDPAGGRLTLDGHDLRGIRLKDTRRHFAMVLQDNLMLPTTIAENIAYGRPDASFEQICEAARQAGAAGFIQEMPDKYNSRVTEGGQNLSGGQRQRIAIARALLTEAPILMLDEPTSALDPHHERLIIQVLRRLKGSRTIILISHRPSTVADCDRIYVLSNGRIVERGTHEELMVAGGLYSGMAEHQLRRHLEIPDLQASRSTPCGPLVNQPHP